MKLFHHIPSKLNWKKGITKEIISFFDLECLTILCFSDWWSNNFASIFQYREIWNANKKDWLKNQKIYYEFKSEKHHQEMWKLNERKVEIWKKFDLQLFTFFNLSFLSSLLRKYWNYSKSFSLSNKNWFFVELSIEE